MIDIIKKIANLLRIPSGVYDHASKNSISILDQYITSSPNASNAFQIFEGTWSSHIPGFGHGHAQLFDDPRIKAFIEECGDVKGKNVLELGPLEGGHTYMLSRAGARVKSIESNMNAFLKCLIVKNALNFDAEFILGDFRPYLSATNDRYDLIVASGVLYHMMEPWKLLQDMARVSKSIGIWTHYYDPEVVLTRSDLTNNFEQIPMSLRIGERDILSHKRKYLEALNWKGFCGGNAPEARWLTRDSLLGLLSDLGFNISFLDEDKNHQNGPCITLFAAQ